MVVCHRRKYKEIIKVISTMTQGRLLIICRSKTKLVTTGGGSPCTNVAGLMAFSIVIKMTMLCESINIRVQPCTFWN